MGSFLVDNEAMTLAIDDEFKIAARISRHQCLADHRHCVEDRSGHIRLIVSRWWICRSVSRTFGQSTESSDMVAHPLRVGRRSRSTRQPPFWESPGPRRMSAFETDRFPLCDSDDASLSPK
jgi:hypothetical protein